MIAIAVHHLNKAFGEKTVLKNVCFSVESGTVFGLLGPSGAGKTTVMKLLTGQIKRDGGTVKVFGTDPKTLTGADRKTFGIMMDQFGLYDRLSCFQNLRVFAKIYGISDSEIRDALAKVGLAGEAKTPAYRLSKGMASRLRLARAFMIDPKILFLDEPTSGLDPETACEMHEMILAEKKKGKTVFLTTHSMAEAEKLCDRVILLHGGSIVEQGHPRELCCRYDRSRRIHLRLKDGRELTLPHDVSAIETIAEGLDSGSIAAMHTSEPNLETVFMELTQKELSA